MSESVCRGGVGARKGKDVGASFGKMLQPGPGCRFGGIGSGVGVGMEAGGGMSNPAWTELASMGGNSEPPFVSGWWSCGGMLDPVLGDDRTILGVRRVEEACLEDGRQ